MEVYFYLPEKYLPDASRQEAWKSGTITTLEQGGKIASAQAWIYQTWAELTRAGCAVRLVHEVPPEGLLVTLSGCLGPDFRPAAGVFFSDIVADGLPHPGAHRHLMQNAIHAQKLPGALYVPHWPQPNLRPRASERGDRFENLGFFGDAANLCPDLRVPAWREKLRARTGLSLHVVGADQWHDYETMDAILAIRGWGKTPWLRKPGTKLYNAWLAGVPFLGGTDSAYRGDGRPGENYLVAESRDALEAHLRQLKDDPAARRNLVAAGTAAARSFSREATMTRWKHLVEDVLPESAASWRKRTAAERATLGWIQAGAAWWDRMVCR